MFVYLKNKSDDALATEKSIAEFSPYGKIKILRLDNGLEFKSNDFQLLLRRNNTKHETSAPYSSQQNRTAERYWRTQFEMVRCTIVENGLPKTQWIYAVMTSTVVRNRCFNNRLKQTSNYAIPGRKPDLSKMRIFGSVNYAYKQSKKKLDPRCEKGIFVGYDRNSPAYLVFYPENSKVFKHRQVKFIDNIAECYIVICRFMHKYTTT